MAEKRKVTIDADLQEIIPSFLDNRKKDIVKLDEFLPAKQYSQIESIAHKLAGNAGSYGFDDLGQIGANLEAACQSLNEAEIANLCLAYKEYLENLEIEYKWI